MNTYSFIFFLVLFFTGISAGIGQAPSREKIQTRILFVGNSYTYFNNLPQILQQIAFAGGNGNVEVQMVAEGGATLRDIWEKGAALKVIREHSWNYVILQDQSSLGNTYIVNGKERIVDQSEFLRYARLFDAEIKKKGAKTVFYLTWAKEDADAREQMALNNAYVSIARDLRDLVAPVGVVWQRVRRQFSKLALYISDKSHPTAAGSYLAAIVLYTTIFRKSPVGLPAELKGNPVDEDGRIDLTKTVSLVDIPAKEARLIKVAAWRTYVQQSRAGVTSVRQNRRVPNCQRLLRGTGLGLTSLRVFGKDR